jgi:hypothetical protein
MTDKKLKNALLQRLDITPQALSQRCQRLKTRFPMTTEDAVYVIAQRSGIILDKYLDKETVSHVRVLLQQVTPASQEPIKRPIRKGVEASREQRVIKIGKDFKFTDPILSRRKILEARDMAGVYPFIYVLENSIRELIDTIMISRYGKNWWDSQAPSPLRKDVSDRMNSDKKHSWHQRRGARPIDYLDLKSLPRLVAKIDKSVVPHIIPSLEWFRQFVDEVYKSRCVVCHMNPLDANNIKALEVRFNQWQRLVTEKKDLIID